MTTAALLLPAVLALPASAAFEVPGFELVYTAPVETTLSQGDLRHPAAVWAEMFDAAERSIDVAQFYVTPKPGERLDPVLDALERAARRGVRVRFLLEKKFETQSKEGIARLAAVPGLELRILDFGARSPGGILHAKYLVVDEVAAYLGSQNFDWRSLKHIHELGLRVTDAGVVRQLSAVFERDWADQPVVAASTGSARAFLVASPPGRLPGGVGPSEEALRRLLDSASSELAVELLDYAPLTREKRFYPAIDNALRAAQARGVRIRLLVSHWNTERPALDHLKSLAVLPGVEVRIVTLPPSAEGPIPYARVIHAKYAAVDGRTLWLGTSNWSGGYLDKSRNVEVVVQDEALARRALALHRELWDSAYARPLDVLGAYPEPRK